MARPLNKALREQIEDSVIAATFIPAKKQAIIDSTLVTMREAAKMRLPEGFLKHTEDLPDDWFDVVDHVYLRHDVDPTAILFWSRDESAMQRRQSGSNTTAIEPFRAPHEFGKRSDWHVFYLDHHNKTAPDDLSWEVILAVQIKEAGALAQQEQELRENVRAVLYSVKSVEKLLEKMPEFARHVPPAPVQYALPVVSTVKVENLLKKVGFDQGVAP